MKYPHCHFHHQEADCLTLLNKALDGRIKFGRALAARSTVLPPFAPMALIRRSRFAATRASVALKVRIEIDIRQGMEEGLHREKVRFPVGLYPVSKSCGKK